MSTQDQQKVNINLNTKNHRKRLWSYIFSIGVISIIGALILTAWKNDVTWFNDGLIFCTAAFVIGFCGTTYPKARDFWKHKLGKWIRRACHALLLFVAIIPARTLVSNAMGLPGQDFDSTVAILAVTIYPALWLLLLAFLCFMIGVVQLIIWFLIQLSRLPIIDDLVKFSGTLIKNERARHFIYKEREVSSYLSLAQWAGATATAMLLLYCFDEIGRTLAEKDQIIKSIAYYTDYQIADDYPGILKHYRYRLHANSVVSYAVKNKGKIDIIVKTIECKIMPSE